MQGNVLESNVAVAVKFQFLQKRTTWKYWFIIDQDVVKGLAPLQRNSKTRKIKTKKRKKKNTPDLGNGKQSKRGKGISQMMWKLGTDLQQAAQVEAGHEKVKQRMLD